LAQGLKKDVGGRFRYAVGLQSWVNCNNAMMVEFSWLNSHFPPFFLLETGRLPLGVFRMGPGQGRKSMAGNMEKARGSP